VTQLIIFNFLNIKIIELIILKSTFGLHFYPFGEQGLLGGCSQPGGLFAGSQLSP
jgi:hypothetical protein